jgi:magnesium-transporting ATPase (P-type)
MDQAILTGEATSVNKSVDTIADAAAVKQDMTNLLFSVSTQLRYMGWYYANSHRARVQLLSTAEQQPLLCTQVNVPPLVTSTSL